MRGSSPSLLGAICVVVTGWVGCNAERIGQPCGEIPPGGCPRERGGSCADAACDAVYDCQRGAWKVTQNCGDGAGGGGAAGAGAATGGCQGAPIDVPSPATGCTPDLQDPDCPVEAAESCMPCASGCSDFFACTASGHVLVAYCDADGGLVLVSGD